MDTSKANCLSLAWVGALAVAAALALSGCAGGGSGSPSAPATYSVNASITGLSGAGLVLQDNGSGSIGVAAGSANATIASNVGNGTGYAVTVYAQPIGQTCTVSAGSGTVASANVTNVTIGCAAAAPATARFVYAGNNGSGTISAYAVNPTSGALTAIAGSPFDSGGVAPGQVRVHPTGRFLYVADEVGGAVMALAINWTTGALTSVPGSPFAAGRGVSAIAFDATGTHLYVANQLAGAVTAFTIEVTTGVLTPVAGSPFALAGTNQQPLSLGVAGNFLYVVDGNQDSVVAFAINGSGALSAASTIATGGSPYSIVIHPSGGVAYVANGNSGTSTLSAYTINAVTGALVPAVTPSIAIPVSNYMGFDPQGKFLFVTLGHGVATYPVNASTAALGAAVAGSPFAAGGNPYSVALDPLGKFVFAADDAGAEVYGFPLNGTSGALGASTQATTESSPDFMGVL